GPVVGLPARVGATGPGPAQLLLVPVDGDRPPGPRRGTPGGQGAGGAGRAEAGHTTAALGRADRCGDAVRAGDLTLGQVDDEVVLGVPAAAVDRRLCLEHRLDAGLLQPVQQLTRAVGRVPVGRRPLLLPFLLLLLLPPRLLAVAGAVGEG